MDFLVNNTFHIFLHLIELHGNADIRCKDNDLIDRDASCNFSVRLQLSMIMQMKRL